MSKELDEYKKSFIDDYTQFKAKRDKLHKMIIQMKAGTLKGDCKCSFELLKHQEEVMDEYLITLEIRAEFEEINLDGLSKEN